MHINHQTARILNIIGDRAVVAVREFDCIRNQRLVRDVMARLHYKRSGDMSRYEKRSQS